ncbi:MAG: PAS domain S-box protein, partial [Chloroflexota bacterium]
MKCNMKNISFTSLRARLMLLVLAVIVPVLGLSVYNGIEGRNNDRLDALADARRLAQNAAMLYEHTIMETRQILFTLTQMPQFRQQDPAACSKIFADLLEQTESYSGFAAAKPNGDVFASAPSLAKPVSFADRPWFQHLVQTRSFVIGEYSIGRLSGKPAVVLGYPVLDHTGQLMAVFSAGLDLGRLQQTLLKIDLPEGTNLTIIDRDGTILLRFPDPEKFVGKKMSNKSIVKTMLTKKEGAQEGVDLGGVPRLYGYTTIGSGIESIHISVGIPEQIAYADVKRHMAIEFTLLGLVSMLALLGAWLFGKKLILSPVNRLLDVTRQLAGGDLTARTGRSNDAGELGLLASNFDQMADSLQRRHDERKLAEEALRKSTEKLMKAQRVARMGFLDWNLKTNEMSWSDETYNLYGIDPHKRKSTTELTMQLVHPNDREFIDKNLEMAVKGEKGYSIDHRVIRPDGKVIWVHAQAELVRDAEGNPESLLGTVVDITDMKLAEEKLRITQFSVDQAAESVAWIEEDGRYRYVNDVYCRLLNYSRDELLSMWVFDVNPNFSTEDWHERWRKRKQEGSSFFESSVRTKDGMLIPVEIHANYLAYEDKEFVVSFTQDIRERKLQEEQLKRQVDRLATLRVIDMAIIASLDLRVTLDVFLEQIITCLHIDAADILLLNIHSYNQMNHVASRGFKTDALKHTHLSLGAGYAGRIAQERKAVCIPDLQKEPSDLLEKSPQISSEDFVAYYGVPLIAKGQVKGVLEIFNRTPIEYDQEWLDFLDALATQAAIAIDNAILFDDLQQSNIHLMQAYDNTLEGWSNALDLRDKETEGHSRRVTEMTLRLARQMGMSDSELVHVRRGALLHDIGKMGIPDAILLKPGPLDDEEWEIMRKH